MPDSWVLIVERRLPSGRPLTDWSYHDEVYGPFDSEGAAWAYAASRVDGLADHAHDVQRVITPTWPVVS